MKEARGSRTIAVWLKQYFNRECWPAFNGNAGKYQAIVDPVKIKGAVFYYRISQYNGIVSFKIVQLPHYCFIYPQVFDQHLHVTNVSRCGDVFLVGGVAIRGGVGAIANVGGGIGIGGIFVLSIAYIGMTGSYMFFQPPVLAVQAIDDGFYFGVGDWFILCMFFPAEVVKCLRCTNAFKFTGYQGGLPGG